MQVSTPTVASEPAVVAEFAERCAREQVISYDIADRKLAARYLSAELRAAVPGRVLMTEPDPSGGTLAGAAALDPLTWDSGIYGLKMAKLSWLVAAGGTAQRRATKRQLAARVVEEAHWRGYKHVSARTIASDHETIHALEEAGFRSMDTQITLAMSCPPSPPECPEGIVIAQFVPDDLSALLDLSTGAYVESRLFVDPDMPVELTKHLHRKWVENDCLGRAAATFVARLKEVPVGYITCLLHRGEPDYGIAGCGDIDLITVSPAVRARGVALALVRSSLAWFAKRIERVIVKTQVTNYKAIALYQRAGFVLEQAFVSLHRTISD